MKLGQRPSPYDTENQGSYKGLQNWGAKDAEHRALQEKNRKPYLGAYGNDMKTQAMVKNDLVSGAKKEIDASHL